MAKSFNQFDLVSLLRNIDYLVGYKGDNGEEIRISGATLAGLFTGTEGKSVQIQFSSNAESWHYPAIVTDKYVRFKAGNDAWSPALKFVGEKGESGTGLDILGTYSTLSALQAAVTNPQQGDMYNVGSAAPYNIYLWDAATTTWINQGQLQGEQGEQGEQGAPGASAYQIWINEGNTGSEQDFLDSLKGEDGQDGQNGTNGQNGQDGQDGQDGLSAYEIWLQEGNSGSEQDFLDSLKGEGIPEGGSFGDKLYVNNNAEAQWLKGRQNYSYPASSNEFRIYDYAQKQTIIFNGSNSNEVRLRVLYDFRELENMEIILFNTSQNDVTFSISFENPIGLITNDNTIKENKRIYAGSMLLLSLTPFMLMAFKMVMITVTDPQIEIT